MHGSDGEAPCIRYSPKLMCLLGAKSKASPVGSGWALVVGATILAVAPADVGLSRLRRAAAIGVPTDECRQMLAAGQLVEHVDAAVGTHVRRELEPLPRHPTTG